MTAEAHKRDTGVEKISQSGRKQPTSIGVQTATTEPGLLPVSDVLTD